MIFGSFSGSYRLLPGWWPLLFAHFIRSQGIEMQPFLTLVIDC